MTNSRLLSDRIISIAKAVQLHALDWGPHFMLIGNVCAEDIADLCGAVLALAQSKPALTDEELLRMAANAIDPYESSGIAIGEYEPETECAIEVYGSELIAFARDVLALAQPEPEPEMSHKDIAYPEDIVPPFLPLPL